MLNEFSKLEQHLRNDLFGVSFSGDTLYIIDDYNIDFNMDDDTLQGFVRGISNIDNIKKVYIYLQKKTSKAPQNSYPIFNIYNIEKPCSLRNIEKTYRKKKMFIDSFANNGIVCRYILYPSINVKPPFHGRYWLSESGGLIVDGSINTVQNKVVLAQIMDEENFQIISNLVLTIINNENNIIFGNEELDEQYNDILKRLGGKRNVKNSGCN